MGQAESSQAIRCGSIEDQYDYTALEALRRRREKGHLSRNKRGKRSSEDDEDIADEDFEPDEDYDAPADIDGGAHARRIINDNNNINNNINSINSIISHSNHNDGDNDSHHQPMDVLSDADLYQRGRFSSDYGLGGVMNMNRRDYNDSNNNYNDNNGDGNGNGNGNGHGNGHGYNKNKPPRRGFPVERKPRNHGKLCPHSIGFTAPPASHPVPLGHSKVLHSEAVSLVRGIGEERHIAGHSECAEEHQTARFSFGAGLSLTVTVERYGFVVEYFVEPGWVASWAVVPAVHWRLLYPRIAERFPLDSDDHDHNSRSSNDDGGGDDDGGDEHGGSVNHDGDMNAEPTRAGRDQRVRWAGGNGKRWSGRLRKSGSAASRSCGACGVPRATRNYDDGRDMDMVGMLIISLVHPPEVRSGIATNSARSGKPQVRFTSPKHVPSVDLMDGVTYGADALAVTFPVEICDVVNSLMRKSFPCAPEVELPCAIPWGLSDFLATDKSRDLSERDRGLLKEEWLSMSSFIQQKLDFLQVQSRISQTWLSAADFVLFVDELVQKAGHADIVNSDITGASPQVVRRYSGSNDASSNVNNKNSKTSGINDNSSACTSSGGSNNNMQQQQQSRVSRASSSSSLKPKSSSNQRSSLAEERSVRISQDEPEEFTYEPGYIYPHMFNI